MKFLAFLLTFLAFTCSNKDKEQTIAICENGNGCEFTTTSLSYKEINKLLLSIVVSEESNASILVLDKCDFKIENTLSEEELDYNYGGTGKIQTIKNFDLKKYLIDNNCVKDTHQTPKDCETSSTVKIYFEGYTTEDGNVSSYYFINFKQLESFMPNDAWQKMMAGKMEGSEQGVVDQFFRKNQMDTYMIMEGKKTHTIMPIGYGNDGGSEYFTSQQFEKDFKKTGKTKTHFDGKNEQVEYSGKDGDGNNISIWLTPANEICLPKGETYIWGFFNMGYITLDHTVYLVAEITGTNYQLKITQVKEGSYQFNPQGYETFQMPIY